MIEELGIDVSEAFARPITPEVLGGSDVIVTMGHSVGVFEIPPGIRHEDWRVGDLVGAPLAEVRRVRADIETRVHALLSASASTRAPRPRRAERDSRRSTRVATVNGRRVAERRHAREGRGR